MPIPIDGGGPTRRIYGIVLHDGREVLLGAYSSFKAACKAADYYYPESSDPFALRLARPGEVVKRGGEITEEYGDGG